MKASLLSVLFALISVPALVEAQPNRHHRDRGHQRDRGPWRDLGWVHFDRSLDREVEHTRARGEYDRLRLTARRGAVACRAVNVTFANGRTRTVYTGRIPENYYVDLDLPGDDRHITRVAMICRAQRGRQAMVRIEGRRDRDRYGERNRRWRRRG